MTVDPEYEDYETELDDELDVGQVRKHNWKTGASRDFWAENLEKFKKLVTKAKIKTVTDPELDISIVEQKPVNPQETREIARDMECYLYQRNDRTIIAESEEKLNEYLEASMERKLEMRGFPNCCRKFYMEQLQEGREDPIYEIACNTPSSEVKENDSQEVVVKDPKPLLNKMWAFKGWEVLPFHPCSFECEKGQQVAMEVFSKVKEMDEQVGMKASGFLNSPMYWSGYHGLAHVKNGFSIGSYDTDERWSEKTVIWTEEHEPKAL